MGTRADSIRRSQVRPTLTIMSTNRYFFIGAHLDDVVLSCVLRLMREQQRGNTVAVATAFTSGLGALGMDTYLGRRTEDKQALAILGVEQPVWLGFPDAIFRHWFYWSFTSIILREHKDDQSLPNRLCKEVMPLLRDFKPDRIFLPLAVGTHIDHRSVHRMWFQLAEIADVSFYEDRPYVLLPGNLQLRMKDLGVTIPVPAAAEAGLSVSSLRAFSSGLSNVVMYKNVLTWKKDRFRYLLWAARKLRTPRKTSDFKLEPEVLATNDESEVKRITQAVVAYRSQFKMLFGDTAHFEAESRSYAELLCPGALYAERYWKLCR